MADEIAAPGPLTTVDPRVELRLSTTGRLIRLLAAGYAVLALLGTVIPPLSEIPVGPVLVRGMSPAAGISLAILAAGALFAGETSHTIGSNLTWRRVGIGLTGASALFGVYVLALFLTNKTDAWWGTSLDIPAFSVGIVMVVLGVAVPLSVSRLESRVIVAQVGSLLVFSLTLVIFLGYIYGDPSVGRLFLRPEISIQEALISVFLAIGVLLIRPARGLLSRASSPGAGGRLLRRFGPVVLFTPALLIFLSEAMPTTERVDALAFIAVGLGLFLLILMSLFVRAIDDTAIEASTSAAAAERARIGLEQEAPLAASLAEILHTIEVGRLNGWDIATRFRPARGSVGGDASAVVALPDGGIGAVLVDLTGHGARPAVRAIRVRDLLVHSLVTGQTPAEAMSIVGWSAPSDELATAVVARISGEGGEVAICSAGHPPVISVGVQSADLIHNTGPVLYLDTSFAYGEENFILSPGDSMVLYSDGVADVQVADGGRTEPELLADLLLAEGGVASRTADLVLGFGKAHPTDDQTVLVIRRDP